MSDRRQRRVLRVEERQGRNGFGWFVVVVVFGGLAVAGASANQPIALVFGAVALLAIVAGLRRSSESTRARTVERASRAPRGNELAAPGRSTAADRPVADPPRLEVEFLKPKRLPRLPARARRIKNVDKNVIGRTPLNIAYFRMFANPARARTFVESAWREFGYVHLLRSADSFSSKEYRKVKDGEFFVENDSDLADELRRADRSPQRPGRHTVEGVGPKKVKVHDPFGSYPVLAIACHVDYWRRAVDVLLERCDLVALDLSGFTARNAGTAEELQRVIELVPIERVILLCDPKSDQRFLEKTIRATWSRMTTRSPNATGSTRYVRCGVTDRFRTVAVKRGNQVGGWEELRSNRKESRQLAAAAQLTATGER